jgi:ribosomal protein L11 methyltransferase
VTISPALVLQFPPGTSAATRDRLVAVLSDHSLVAIHEDDVASPTRWVAHFSDDASRSAAQADVRDLTETSNIRVEPLDVPDDDWARRTQADLPAIRIGRVTIAPPWDAPTSPSRAVSGFSRDNDSRTGDVLVIIEPSRGFGTGHHQSTRLCLTLLQTRNLGGLTVTDVGTGSGVLAITAAKLGAARIEAIDSDPDAIENARENIERNGVADRVRAHVQDLTEPPPAPADVVTANLTGTLLARHVAALVRFVKPDGVLIVSGFNVEEREMVVSAFAPAFAVSESGEEDDWWAFVLARTAPRAWTDAARASH